MSTPPTTRPGTTGARRALAVAAAVTAVLAAVLLTAGPAPAVPGAVAGGADTTTVTTLPPGVDGDDTLPPVPANVTQTTATYRTTDGRDMGVRIFRSPDADGDDPAVVLIHGGGWFSGSAETMDPWGGLLADAGWVAFSIDYRLATQGGGGPSWPQAFEDVQAGVEWVHANAGRFGGDPTRLAVFGESAGAHLTVLLAEQGTGGQARIRVASAWSAPLDLAALVPGPDGTVPGCGGDAACQEGWALGSGGGAVEWFLGCTPDQCPSTYAAASPLGRVTAGTTPLWIANSTEELVPLPPVQTLAGQLGDAGVDHELVVVEGEAHAHGYGEDVWNDMVPWLAARLDVPSPDPVDFGDDGPWLVVGGAVVAVLVVVGLGFVVVRRRSHDGAPG